MNPIQSSPAVATRRRPRRHPLQLPQHDVSFLAAPSSGGSKPISEAKRYSDLVRGDRIGSGAVYKVVHGPTSSPYALKVIYRNDDEAMRDRIRGEMEILRDVNHPNVVKCHEVFDQDGEIQVLLEFMDKGSLEGAHVWTEEPLAVISRQIITGLAYLHGRRIVHGAIKPSNLLINSATTVKIADFGVSRILEQTMDPCHSPVGDVAYMGPERINTDVNQGQYDGYAEDIWSLGVSILEFYLGKFPFPLSRRTHWASLMYAISISQPPVAPESASPEFRHFISCCLQRDPAKRSSAIQLLKHPFICRESPTQKRSP